MRLPSNRWNGIESLISLVKLSIWLLVPCGVLETAIRSRADSFQLLTARNPVVLQPAGGNGDSVSPVLTPDGRFALFSSSANDLVPGTNGYFSLNLFLRDRASNSTVLVSANYNGTGGGNGSSINGMVSTNDRWVVFQSDASDLLAGDTNNASDIFVRDLQTGSNILVSVAMGGGWADGASTDPAMTPDGHYVAFISKATNLVPNDTNGIPDVFVRDLLNQTTVLASVGAVKGPLEPASSVISSGPPVITPDGTRMAFFSAATNLVAGVPDTSAGEVYLRDFVANQTFWVSSNALAVAQIVPGADHYVCYHPVMSEDGNFVVFKISAATGQKTASILKFNVGANSLSMVASNCLPLMFNDDVYGPEISADARFIAFAQGSPTNGRAPYSTVFMCDTQAGTNIPVSVASDGSLSVNSESQTPVVSPDGRFVTFVSNATNLVTNVIGNGFHLYIRDLIAGSTTLVDADTNAVGTLDEYGNAPSMSADGGSVAFATSDGGLVGNDWNHARDVFVRNMTNGVSEMISVRNPAISSTAGNGFSSAAQLSITPDGRWAVFSSAAEDLVTNDNNQNQDVFVRDMVGGATALGSVGVDGQSAAGYSDSPMISTNGQILVFYSRATNLVAGHTNLFGDVFLRDLVAGTNTLVSVSADGVTGGLGRSSGAAMSQDGRYVAFLSSATNLVVPGSSATTNTFLRDMVSGVTIALTRSVSAAFPPSISANGRYVAYATSTGLAVWDIQAATSMYQLSAPVSSVIISPDGVHLCYQNGRGSPFVVTVLDLVAKKTVFSTTSKAAVRTPAQWSADGRFIAFAASSNVVSGPFSYNQVYLGDVTAGTIALVSSTMDYSTGGDDVSDNPVMSGNGRYVVYRSFADNIAPGAKPGSKLILYDRATGSNSVIAVAEMNPDWTSWTSRPVMDASGQMVIFPSVQSSLVAGDLNRASDIFKGQLDATSDSDGDGIPDWWMIKYFGHATASAADNSRPQDDADGDGISNLAEFQTGSEPTDPQSALRLAISSNSGAQSVTLNWPAVPGKSYQVQYKTNLSVSTWQNLGSPVVANPGVSAIVPLTTPTGYYRVVAIN